MKRALTIERYLLVALPVLLVSLPAALFAGPGAATTTPIPVLNPQFNLDVLPCSPGGNCNQYGITGWVTGPQTFVMKASTAQYPGAPSTGLYVAAIGSSSCTGSIMQTLAATVQANTTYTLQLSVGAREDEVYTGYLGSIMAGNVTLASGSLPTPVGGTFITDIITYNSGPTPAQLGQPLQILIKSMGTGQVNIAHVAMFATPAAEF